MFQWLRSLVASLRRWLSDDEDPRGFRRSELDESVLEAHGADVDALDRTIEDIQEQVREIEDANRDE